MRPEDSSEVCALSSIHGEVNIRPTRPVIKVNEKGYFRDVTLEDWTIDVSLLGVSIPFGVFDVHDERVKKQ